MFFDPMYFLIVGPGILLALLASWRVKSTFRRFSEVPARSGMTGADVAREMIRKSRVSGVRVEPHEGTLSDHYDPREKVVRLSSDVYYGRSLAALGVAAHECGHVLQDAQGYAPMRFRQSLVGPANFGSSLSMFVIIGGAALQIAGLIWAGIIAFSVVVLFQLVTLPVEFNASSRARAWLTTGGVLAADEGEGVSKVLNAAALTYVAAMISSVLTLVYFILRFAGSSRDD